MAVKVIKHGETHFTAVCANCGCEFSYDFEDLEFYGYLAVDGNTYIDAKAVKCPDCGHWHIHKCKRHGDLPYEPYLPNSLDYPNRTGSSNCDGCWFYENYLKPGLTYIGDAPCQWCAKYPFRITFTNCNDAESKFTVSSSNSASASFSDTVPFLSGNED